MANTIKNYADMRAALVAKLQKLLDSCEEKRPLPLSIIHERMDIVRQNMLDVADTSFYSPPEGKAFNNDHLVSISEEQNLEQQYHVFLRNKVNKPNELSISQLPEAMLELLHQNIFLPEEMTEENIKHILNEYTKIQIVFNRIMAARVRGDYGYERQFYRNITTPMPQAQTVPSEAKPSIMLIDFIDTYIETKVKDKHWKPHSIPDYKNRLSNIIDILGNKPIESISRDDMRTFRDTLRKLPPNRKKSPRYRDLSVQEILDLQPTTVLNIKTVNIVVEAVASMFEWGIREELVSTNPAKSLQIKDERQEITLKDAFTPSDITAIFFSGTYTKHAFKYPAYYWVPLIALYSGMRLEEICQLDLVDIVQQDDIWYFDVNLNPSQNGIVQKLIKTKNSIRHVPIHEVLIHIGFLEHVQQMKLAQHERLFPELNKTSKSPKYGKQVSKIFSKFIKDSGITGNKSFHSLRHTFSDYFKKHNQHSDIFKQVFGHAITALSSRQYGSKFSIQQCYHEVINQLTYNGETR